MNKYVIIVLIICFSSCNEKNQEVSNGSVSATHILQSSNIVWEKLNPARGDKSPQAGTIWGNRNDTVATGFLAKFVDGFSSPPHIHNATYRAVVIKGKIHNDDPNAANMWMGTGSFWTQPKGEPHITSAKGEENIAYVEIDSGPYLVRPVRQAFDTGERPINIDVSNIYYLTSDLSKWLAPNSNAEISFLWKSTNNLKGLFVKLPKGFIGSIKANGTILHAVIISGEIEYSNSGSESTTLDPGSYFHSDIETVHYLSTTEMESVLYIRTTGELYIES